MSKNRKTFPQKVYYLSFTMKIEKEYDLNDDLLLAKLWSMFPKLRESTINVESIGEQEYRVTLGESNNNKNWFHEEPVEYYPGFAGTYEEPPEPPELDFIDGEWLVAKIGKMLPNGYLVKTSDVICELDSEEELWKLVDAYNDEVARNMRLCEEEYLNGSC